jgi:hypothetical protein
MAAGIITGLDRYTIQARLLPVVIVFLPLCIAITSLFPLKELGWGLLTGSITGLACMVFLSQIGRDLGKKKEPSLFKLWGGTPTTLIMRFHNTWLNEESLARYHRKLSALVNVPQPTKELEEANPTEADKAYTTFVDYLKSKTRSPDQFSMVIEENINYGFRRNLWGMRAVGILISATSVLLPLSPLLVNFEVGWSLTKVNAIACAINVCFLILWLLRISTDWVKLAATAYAERLVASTDNLEVKE